MSFIDFFISFLNMVFSFIRSRDLARVLINRRVDNRYEYTDNLECSLCNIQFYFHRQRNWYYSNASSLVLCGFETSHCFNMHDIKDSVTQYVKFFDDTNYFIGAISYFTVYFEYVSFHYHQIPLSWNLWQCRSL